MRSKLSLLVSMLALSLGLIACSGTAAGGTQTVNRNLTVTGSGTVYLTPDIAYLYVGVLTEDADIAQAVSRNSTQTQAVVDALQNMGIATEDIQTSNFSLWSGQDVTQTGEQYTKYTVDNTVYITVRDLTKLGSLLNTVVNSGANNINSITFDVADRTAALAEARQKAMDNANSLANELVQTAALQLGEIQNITYSDYTPSPYYGMGGGGAAPNASVPIQPGQLQISVTVNVTYELK